MNNKIPLYKNSRLTSLPPLKTPPKRNHKHFIQRPAHSQPKLTAACPVENTNEKDLRNMISHYELKYLYPKMSSLLMKDREGKRSFQKVGKVNLKLKEKRKKVREKLLKKGEDSGFVRYEEIEKGSPLSLRLKLDRLNTISYQDDQTIPRNCLLKFFTPRNNNSIQPLLNSFLPMTNKQLIPVQKQKHSISRSSDSIQLRHTNNYNPKIKLWRKSHVQDRNITGWRTTALRETDMMIK